MNNVDELRILFEEAQRELLQAQGELSALIADTAADPWLETQQERRRAQLTSRRDQILQRWSRLGLSWLIRGGEISLQAADGSRPPASHAPASPRSRPPVALVQRSSSAPVVQTLRRNRSEVIEYGQHHSTAGWRQPSSTPMQDCDHELLHKLLKQMGRPETMESAEDVRDELERLLQTCTPSVLDDWTLFPKSIQKALIGQVVARARHVQDDVTSTIFPRDLSHDLDRIFSAMTAFSKREQPGFVFGLMRQHRPRNQNWLSDATKWWDDLFNQIPGAMAKESAEALLDLEEAILENSDDEEIIDCTKHALASGIEPSDTRLIRLLAPKISLLKGYESLQPLRQAIRDHSDSNEE